MFLEYLTIKKNLLTIKKLNYTGGNRVEYDFSNFSSLGKFFKNIFYGKILIPAAEIEQNEFNESLKLLKKYRASESKYKKKKEDTLVDKTSMMEEK